jgi:hypothetical protein
MHWTIVAPFFRGSQHRWLDAFVPPGRHTFAHLSWPGSGDGDWHRRSSSVTKLQEWLDYWRYGGNAWKARRGGIITVFPQLAAAVGFRQRACNEQVPVVAWCFNIGALAGGLKRRLARWSLSRIDRFVVHSRGECRQYSDWLQLPANRFRFVHLQRPLIPITCEEDKERPFVLAMGSAHRDYATLFQAIGPLGLRTVVVAAKHALKDITVPDCVEIRSNLSRDDCYRLAQQARINVIPISNDTTASGQVTVIEAMCLARPIIATRCMGTEDYVEHGRTGLLVRMKTVDELRDAILRLWDDGGLRERLGADARRFAAVQFSDEAAGLSLQQILDELEVDSEKSGLPATPEVAARN